MRIASYNILSGGFNNYRDDLKEPERINTLKQAINSLQADFVGLIDTYKWDEIYKNEQIAELFGYKLAYCINLNDDRLRKIGHNNGITVLTNNEVKSFETISLKTRDVIKTRILRDDKELDIYTVYLDDLSEDTRVQQVSALLNQVDKAVPSIIMGDLNTFKTTDLPKLTPMIDKFYEDNPQLHAKYGAVTDGMKSGRALSKLEESGFVDGAQQFDPTAPTHLFPVKIDEPFLRLDYAFSHGINISNFRVPREDIFDRASDHYPIVFDCQTS